MGRGQGQATGIATGESRRRHPETGVIPPGYYEFEQPIPVKAPEQPGLSMTAVGRNDDWAFVLLDDDPPDVGHWVDVDRLEGFTTYDFDAVMRGDHEGGPLPEFNIRKVRMSVEVKMGCATCLSIAAGKGTDALAQTLGDDWNRDLVEGGYIRPDGTFTDLGIKAATATIGEAFVERHLQAIAARSAAVPAT